MRTRKPNRVTTPRKAVLGGTRSSHASMPRTRSRWRPAPGRHPRFGTGHLGAPPGFGPLNRLGDAVLVGRTGHIRRPR
jgi:hypothetical protein